MIIRILFIASANDRTGRVKILLVKCVVFVVPFRKKKTLEASLSRPTSFVVFFGAEERAMTQLVVTPHV